ncbi:DedA family protein [Corynebacterium sp. UBA2622]|uniref:DedA family protein n=1 Tax=Corynebacterium sp. UBA2622 TaxID=1946393 RepID=UPI0025C5AFD3|nr:DedA family protein [Corynebacterium sp. UBA2622]
MQAVIDWVVHLMEVLGAPGVGIAILLENLFPPIPSEFVLPLAGFTVAQGSLNLVEVFLWSVAGSVAGAYALYFAGAWLGVDRLRRIAGRMWLVRVSDVDSALGFFRRYGRVSVLFGRLIPGIRSLISIPAGLDRMNPLAFGLWTALGSAAWNAALLALGYFLGENWHLVGTYIGAYANVVYLIVLAGLATGSALLIRRSLRERAGIGGTTR